MKEPFIDVPTWENGAWRKTTFETRDDFRLYLLTLFKEPGKYEFDETALLFNEQANNYRKNKQYCAAPVKSKDFIHYWETEKEKCRRGVLFHNNGKTWYLTRDYYMWINFLPINDKAARKFDFPGIWDSQYHMALYEVLAELHYMHCAVLKKRQFGSSYFHCAKLINQIWFEESCVLKMGASLKDYVNEKGSWKFLNEYRSFLNENTAWYRHFDPKGVGMWQQQVEKKDSASGRTYLSGNKGVLSMVTFEKDPTSGVGGAITYFFHEEAGIAPHMDETLEYLLPALQLGDITTGTFIAAGTVGDLDQCKPLENLIYKPRKNSIYPVWTNLLDEKGTEGETGLFIPEQWSMPPYIDEFGNSMVEEALEHIRKKRIEWKQALSPQMYQLRISQHPINIREAFATRKVSKFPTVLLNAQRKRIEDKEYPYWFMELYKDGDGKIKAKETNKLPISEFPVDPAKEDKSGSIVVYEKPDENPEFGLYYASVDPVSEGKTTSSDSLCSIYVYKYPVEKTILKDGKTETFIEGDKIVAAWCGRFDDINKTHERLELIIEWYNARTIVENNVPGFITHMIKQRKQRYLVQKNEMVFLKDLGANNNVFQEYGWRNVGTMFRGYLLTYLIDYLKEEINQILKEDGTVLKTVYGIERIPDIMAITEMEKYEDDLNVDRLVALSALIAFIKIQVANRGYKKQFENQEGKQLEKSDNFRKLVHSPFRHVGGSGNGFSNMNKPRNPFKNLR